MLRSFSVSGGSIKNSSSMPLQLPQLQACPITASAPIHPLHSNRCNYGLQILWQASIYLEAVAILPQLTVIIRTQNIDNLTGNYIALLGSYRAFYILNWIYRYFTEDHFVHWLGAAPQLMPTGQQKNTCSSATTVDADWDTE